MANTTATTSITINTAPNRVWQALTDPKLVKQYLFDTDMTGTWEKGGSVRYRGEWQGQSYEDKGTVLEIEPEHIIVMDYFSPASGKPDAPENHQVITYLIAAHDDVTKLTVTQDNNIDEADAKRAEDNWQSILQSLKKLVEEQ
jgi:uncharacterized protein YndB with AHSA1/START domain